MWLVHFFTFICYYFAKLQGWRFFGKIPDGIEKAVIIFAPHTSSWDFIYAMGFYRYYTFNLNYFGKDSLQHTPLLRTILDKTGYIPVDRSQRHNLVAQTIERFEKSEQMYLSISPEGTRKRVDRWKTGFYQIAVGANLPLILASIDYKKKEIGLAKIIQLSGNKAEDFAVIREFYRDKQGKNPEDWNPDFE